MKKIVCPKCGSTVAIMGDADRHTGTPLKCPCGLTIELDSNNGGTMNVTIDEIHPKDNVGGGR